MFCLDVLAATPGAGTPAAVALESPAKSESSFLYIIPKPVEMELVVGPWSRALNYTYHFGSLIPKYLVFFGPHLPALVPLLGWTAMELSHISASMAVYNLGDLQIRKFLAAHQLMKQLKAVPDIKQAYLVSGGAFQWNGIMAKSRKVENFVILESNRPLPEPVLGGKSATGWDPRWGSPIPVADPERAIFLFRLNVDGKNQPVAWKISLGDLIRGTPMPAKIREKWKKSLKAANKNNPGWLNQTLHHLILHPLPERPADRVRLDASLKVPGLKGKVSLHAVAIGNEVENLLGAGFWGQLRAKLHLTQTGVLPLSQREFGKPAEPARCATDFEALAMSR